MWPSFVAVAGGWARGHGPDRQVGRESSARCNQRSLAEFVRRVRLAARACIMARRLSKDVLPKQRNQKINSTTGLIAPGPHTAAATPAPQFGHIFAPGHHHPRKKGGASSQSTRFPAISLRHNSKSLKIRGRRSLADSTLDPGSRSRLQTRPLGCSPTAGRRLTRGLSWLLLTCSPPAPGIAAKDTVDRPATLITKSTAG